MSSGLGGFLFGNIDEEGKLDNEDFDEELRANLTTFSEKIQDKKILLEGGFLTEDLMEEISGSAGNPKVPQNKNVLPLPEAENFEDITELADQPLNEKSPVNENEPVQQEHIGLVEPLTCAPSNFNNDFESFTQFDTRKILKFTRLSAKPSLLNATGRSYSRYATLRKLRLKRKQLHGKTSSFSAAENQIDAFLNRTGPSLNVPSAAAARLRLSLINLSAGAAGPVAIPPPSAKIKKPWHQSNLFHDLEKALLKTKNFLHHEENKIEARFDNFRVKLPDNSHFHPISLFEWENEIIWDSENFQGNINESKKGMYVNLSGSTVLNTSTATFTGGPGNAVQGSSNSQQSSNLGGASLSSILSSLSLSNGALGGDSVTSSATATALLALIRNQQMRSASISTSSLGSSRLSFMGPTGNLSRSNSTTSTVAPAVKLKFPKAPAARILNREFENGDWLESIIWDVELTDAQKLNTHLILPLDDPELIFTAIPVENLSKKLGRAEKLIAKRLKKLQTSNSAITSFAKPIMDKFNLSNDKYYESAHGIENDSNSTSNSKPKSSQDQTTSGNKAISSRSSVSATFLGLHHSVPALQHSVPALKLAPPAFQTCRTKRELRLWHRPRFSIPANFTISSWLKVKSPNAIKKTANSQKITDFCGNLRLTLSCNPSGGIIRSAKKLTLKDSCRFVLLEYFEEFPPLLMNPGMGAYIVLYYRKKSPQDTFIPRSTFALIQVLDFTDPSPFMMFGDVPAGSSRYALCNGLFRAPLIQHKSPNSDFIVSRHGDTQSADDFPRTPEPEFFLRPLESAPVMLVGQEFPLVEVPGPHSRRHNIFCRQRLQVAAYRLFNKDPILPESGHSRKRLKIGRLLTSFPQFSEGSIRKWLKEFAESTRAGKDSGVWLLKEDAPQLDEDELRALVTPETICQYESMMAEQQRLSDAELIFYDPFNLHQFEEEVEESGGVDDNSRGKTTKIRSKELEELTTAAPWNTTANFLNAIQGRCTLKLRGIGDPSGRSEAFSFVKAPGEKGTSSSVANSVGSDYRQDISRIWESHINSISQGAINAVNLSAGNNINVSATMTTSTSVATISSSAPSFPEGCKLVISRRFGADQWVCEEITDPLVIRAYLRVRQNCASSSAADKKLRRAFVAPDALPTLSASDAAPLSTVKAKKKPASKEAGGLGTKTLKKPATTVQTTSMNATTVEKSLQIKCGACGQVGHMRTNRICPMFSDGSGSTISSIVTSSSATTGPELKLKLKLSTNTLISSNESIYPSPVLLPVSQRPKGPEIEPLQRKRPRRKLTAKQVHAQFLASQSIQVKSKLAALSTILISIVDGLILLPSTLAFHKPVPRKLYPLYYKLISHPIDLSSIRSKAVALSYKNSQEFLEDFNLLLSNCVTFNGQEAPLSDVARDMLARVKVSLESEEIKEIDTFLEQNISKNENQERFTDNNEDEDDKVHIEIDQGDDVSIMTDQEEEASTATADVDAYINDTAIESCC